MNAPNVAPSEQEIAPIAEHSAELKRIRAVYDERQVLFTEDFYARYQPSNLFFRHGQEEALLWALKRCGMTPLNHRRVLDVGCGRGDWLLTFQQFGAEARNLCGIELDPTRAVASQRLLPTADIREGNAAALPWPEQTFDVVLQSTVFTSIHSPELKHAIAAEMLRVLKPSGAIFWYDFFVNNPNNPNVLGVGSGEIRRLFPQCDIELRRTTLAPPVARRVAPWSPLLAQLLRSMRVLNTHYFAIIRRRHS